MNNHFENYTKVLCFIKSLTLYTTSFYSFSSFFFFVGFVMMCFFYWLYLFDEEMAIFLVENKKKKTFMPTLSGSIKGNIYSFWQQCQRTPQHTHGASWAFALSLLRLKRRSASFDVVFFFFFFFFIFSLHNCVRCFDDDVFSFQLFWGWMLECSLRMCFTHCLQRIFSRLNLFI